MRRLTVLSMVLLLSGCGTIGGWFSSKDNNEPPAPLTEFSPTLTVETLWSKKVNAGSGERNLHLAPFVSDEHIYVADAKGRVSAHHLEDGRVHWQTDTGLAVSAGPGVGDGLVVVGTSNGELLALDRNSGELRWQQRVPSEVLATPVPAQGLVVVRTGDGRVRGLSGQDGALLWEYGRAVPALSLRGTSDPVVVADGVLVGLDSGLIVVLGLENGKLLWEQRIASPRGRSELERMVDIDATPLIIRDNVYVASYQGRVTALDLRSGRLRWRRDMSTHTNLDSSGSSLFLSDAESNVWALDRFSSASVWRQSKLERRALTGPSVLGEHVVVGDFEGYLHWLRNEDGQFAARVRVDDSAIARAPVVRNDILYVLSTGGVLAALRPSAP